MYCSEEVDYQLEGNIFTIINIIVSYDNEYVPWGCSNSSALEKFYKDYVGGKFMYGQGSTILENQHRSINFQLKALISVLWI